MLASVGRGGYLRRCTNLVEVGNAHVGILGAAFGAKEGVKGSHHITGVSPERAQQLDPLHAHLCQAGALLQTAEFWRSILERDRLAPCPGPKRRRVLLVGALCRGQESVHEPQTIERTARLLQTPHSLRCIVECPARSHSMRIHGATNTRPAETHHTKLAPEASFRSSWSVQSAVLSFPDCA